LSGKNEKIYDEMFELIVEFGAENGISLNPKISMTDFEKASINCIRRTFPDVKAYGCNFHFGQILYRWLQKLNLVKKYGNDEQFSIEIKSMMALSDLTSEEIPVFL
jgi:hypothetical protein